MSAPVTDGKKLRDARNPPRVWHPIFFTVFPALDLYSQNLSSALFRDAFAAILASLGILVALWVTARIEFKDRQARGVFVSCLTFLVFYLGSIWSWLHDGEFGGIAGRVGGWRLAALALVGVLILFYAVYRWLRRPRALAPVTRFLNLLSFSAVLICGANLGWTAASMAAQRLPRYSEPFQTGAAPSIYVLVLDAYAGVDILNDFYGHDNEPFLQALESRGFYVAKESHGNYNFTVLSVPSMLNLKYILEDGETPVLRSVRYRENDIPAGDLIRNSVVAGRLKSTGYRHIAFRTGYAATEIPDADQYLSYKANDSEFLRAFLKQSGPYVLGLQAGLLTEGAEFIDRYRKRTILYTLDGLESLDFGAKPHFVFAHLMTPHEPFLFDADGTDAPPEDFAAAGPAFNRAYREQLKFVNSRVLEIVDAIQARTPDAVIVIAGDHGPRNEATRDNGSWENYARDWLSTLTAVYIPERRGYDQLYPQISMANIFRVVFNILFDAGYAVLPDISYLQDREDDSLYVPVLWDGYTPKLATGKDTESAVAR